MSLFGKLFKKEVKTKVPRGFFEVQIKQINRLTSNAVEVVFLIPKELKEEFKFTPGQYVNVCINIDGKEERRSYSICSDSSKDEIAIGVKEIDKGTVSKWFNQQAKENQTILISKPEGRFTLIGKNVVAIAAGSGITPILSMAHEIEKSEGSSMTLLYANRTEQDILFRSKLDGFSNVIKHYYLTQETKEQFRSGRITKESFIDFIKEDLSVLKADGFYICGPEQMIFAVKEALEMFGVSADKIHFELFNPSTETKEVKKEIGNKFNGVSKVQIILDDEVHRFEMKSSKHILDAAISQDIDAPYSCRGGVCSTCRAKVIKGTVEMNLNYTLTDKEVADGYILTCQSHPTSEELIISYDE